MCRIKLSGVRQNKINAKIVVEIILCRCLSQNKDSFRSNLSGASLVSIYPGTENGPWISYPEYTVVKFSEKQYNGPTHCFGNH